MSMEKAKRALVAAGWVEVGAIRMDERYSAQVEGGVAQRDADADGLVLRMRDRDVVIDADTIALKMRELGWTCEPPGAAAARDKWVDGSAVVVRGKKRR